MNIYINHPFLDFEDLENLDEIIKEIKENTYDNELADIYI